LLDQQGNSNQKGIQPVKPLQKDLKVHLPSWQQGSVTEGPVRAGKTGLHHAGGSADHDQGDNRHHEVGTQQHQDAANDGRRLCQGVLIEGGTVAGDNRWQKIAMGSLQLGPLQKRAQGSEFQQMSDPSHPDQQM
jgi:hypothetical protein